MTQCYIFHKIVFEELHNEVVVGAKIFEFFGTQKIKKQQQKFAKSHYPLYSFVRDLINVYRILLTQKLNTNVKFC